MYGGMFPAATPKTHLLVRIQIPPYEMSNTPPLQFEFTSAAAPVQAVGTVAGRRFYFRARHEEWEFVVAGRESTDSNAQAEREWYRSGVVPEGRSAASYLPLETASALIRECAATYLYERAG